MKKQILTRVWEASYIIQINLTKNWLEFNRKKVIPMNLNVGTQPKIHTAIHKPLNLTEIWMNLTKNMKINDDKKRDRQTNT